MDTNNIKFKCQRCGKIIKSKLDAVARYNFQGNYCSKCSKQFERIVELKKKIIKDDLSSRGD